MTDRIKEERARLLEIIKTAPENKRRALEAVIDNLAWMRVKMDDTREAIQDEPVAIEYDNGGGQTGIRENPAYKGYEALWRSYVAGIGKIIDAVPDISADIVDTERNPKTVLEMVRKKHNA